MNHVLGALARRPVLTTRGLTLTWEDVAARAWTWGEWQVAEETARLSRIGLAEAQPPPERLAEEERRFALARGLEGTEAVASWLRRWEVSEFEWLVWLAGRRPRLVSAELERPVKVETRAGAVEAICGGALQRWAQRLAEELALAGPDADELEVVRALAWLRREAVTPEQVARLLSERRRDWTRVALVRIVHDSPEVLREIVAARRGGAELDALASDELTQVSGVAVQRVECVLADLDPALRARVERLRPGEMPDPVADGGQWEVTALLERSAPAAYEPETWTRAEAELTAAALARLVARQVRWHGLTEG